MKKLIKNLVVILIIINAINTTSGCFSFKANQTVYASNQSQITMEVSTGRVLYKNNETAVRPMASTTKIMTAITVIENISLEKTVKIKPEYVGIEGSSIYLKADEKITIHDLLYGLMLRSGNDSAVALACETAGSIESFAKLMNDLAIKIGALNTNFVNPHGLHNDNHYTTALDLAKISCYGMQNETFKKIVSTKKIQISSPYDYPRILINKNKMLNEYDGATGIKTGFTKKAGRCLVSSAKKDNMEVVCVVLGCPPMFEVSKQLLTMAFKEYQMVEIFNSNNFDEDIKINGSDKKCKIYTKGIFNYPLTQSELSEIKINIAYDKSVNPPFKKDFKVGKIEIYIDKQLLFCENIYTIIGVTSKDYKYILKDVMDSWLAI